MDQKNFIIAIVLSVLIIVGWQYAFPPAKSPVTNTQQTTAATTQPGSPQAPAQAPGQAPGTQGTVQPGAPAAQPVQVMSRTDALAQSPRVTFDTPELVGSIALKGGRIDDVRLVKYRETVDPKSPPVPVLSPVGSEHPYYAEFGWSAADPSTKVPGPDTLWTASATTVAPGKPVRLTWDNGQGLIFALDVSLDDYFMFDVKQSVENKTDKPVTVYPWSLIVRYGEPKAEGIYILHEGPYGVFNNSYKEFSYSDFKDNKSQKIATTGGWVGMTDKYWMATLIPEQQQKVDVSIKQTGAGPDLKYQIDYVAPGQAVAPGATATTDAKLFAGAKIVRVISDYEQKYGIEKFNLTIDWGWFWFFTKPLFWLLEWLFVHIGNFGIAILVLTVIVKAVFFPLANKSYAAMSKMKALQPEMEKLKERYGEDRQRMNQELMQLYRREKVNPAAGCLPIVVQIPVFFALYKVLYTSIEMRHQPFFGWIKDLSAPDPLTILTGFGLFDWQVPQFLHFFNIGIWPLIMGVTMYLQQKLNPAPTDPVQARVFQFLPILFTFMLAPFAAGLVIYWAWSNTLSIAQQYTIMRRHGAPIGGKAAPKPAKPAVAAAGPAPAPPADGGGKKGGKAKKR
ncbi:MAG: membrane protein insertase YidC [Reyranella sp.]|nr:membrane protein insertase YidC [Reyranella sp.]MBL6651551.1 membrane protein insertase YidC [Reyranella sp.]